MQNTPTQEMKQITYLPTTERVEVESYPYGRLRATAFFGLEFKKGKGFRTTFQTINPKNNRLNAVKNSTYSSIMAMYEAENGHIKYVSFNLYGVEEINKAAHFMHENFNLYTPEQIEDIASSFFVHLKASAKAIVIYCGANFEEVKPILDPAVTAAIKMIKDPTTNIFDSLAVDVEKYEATKDPNFQPFRTTEAVPLSSMMQ
jgi:hypothetical protein